MPKIFIFSGEPDEMGDIPAFALAEDGTGLASHLSSSRLWQRHDMGLITSTSLKHRTYREHYPNGYELVDLLDASDDELDANVEFMTAMKLNKEE